MSILHVMMMMQLSRAAKVGMVHGHGSKFAVCAMPGFKRCQGCFSGNHSVGPNSGSHSNLRPATLLCIMTVVVLFKTCDIAMYDDRERGNCPATHPNSSQLQSTPESTLPDLSMSVMVQTYALHGYDSVWCGTAMV